MKTLHRTPPLTEEQILRNRHDEARAIKEAWDYRLKCAQIAHRDAMKTNGDVLAARRAMDAAEIQVADAAGELRLALNALEEHTFGRRHAA